MPWKECQKMDEKLRFVSRHLEGESILKNYVLSLAT